MTIHRAFSALAYSVDEYTTESFMVLAPFAAASISKRAAHTARAIKALEIHTKLLAIPGAAERHSLFSMCVVAQMATTQISACKYLLEDHALAIGRDRLRLSIGFLNTMGTFWPLGKKMAKEVKAVARAAFSGVPETTQMNANAEIDLERDELMWPSHPSAQIDIYAGTVLPIDWVAANSGYNSSTSSMYNSSNPSTYTGSTPASQNHPSSSNIL